MKILYSRALLATFGLALLAACGGGSSSGNVGSTPVPPAAFDYTNPPATGFRVERDAARSTPTHLVLNVVAPAGSDLRGLTLALQVKANVATWVPVQSGDPLVAQNPRFDPGTAPKLERVKVEGGLLSLAFLQKGTTVPSVQLPAGGTVASVALDLNPAVGRPSNADLRVLAGRAQVVTGTGSIQAPTVGVGSLRVP